jgi:hypothetical protein
MQNQVRIIIKNVKPQLDNGTFYQTYYWSKGSLGADHVD